MVTVTLNNSAVMVKLKNIEFSVYFQLKADQNSDSLVFQTDSVINVTKNGETKIYKAVQRLKSLVKQNDGKAEVVADIKLESNLNLLIENTLLEEQKMGEDLDLFLSNNASQKRNIYMRQKKNQTVHYQNYQNKIEETF